MDKKVLYGLSYGLYGITVKDTTKPTGCVVNTVFQITSEGPVIALSLNHDNYTTEVLKKEGRFAVSIFSEKTDPNVIGKLGFFSGRDTNKLEGMAYHMVEDLAILDEQCSGYMICEVVDSIDTATHQVFLGKVVAGEVLSSEPAMTYGYYRNVIKGSSPKNAPSYQAPQEEVKAEQFICDVCGYQYNGDISKEGADYHCPICKVDVNHFKKAEKSAVKSQCDICHYIYEGDISKEGADYICPICKADLSHFKSL